MTQHFMLTNRLNLGRNMTFSHSTISWEIYLQQNYILVRIIWIWRQKVHIFRGKIFNEVIGTQHIENIIQLHEQSPYRLYMELDQYLNF